MKPSPLRTTFKAGRAPNWHKQCPQPTLHDTLTALRLAVPAVPGPAADDQAAGPRQHDVRPDAQPAQVQPPLPRQRSDPRLPSRRRRLARVRWALGAARDCVRMSRPVGALFDRVCRSLTRESPLSVSGSPRRVFVHPLRPRHPPRAPYAFPHQSITSAPPACERWIDPNRGVANSACGPGSPACPLCRPSPAPLRLATSGRSQSGRTSSTRRRPT